MTLDTSEFIRRFLMHVLPQGFHRIRYYGLLTSQTRAKNIARARELLAVPFIPIDAIKAASATPEEPKQPEHPCPCCGGPLEWFNLAAKHGWRKYLLHDDFYDQDGTADVPKIESYSPKDML